MLGFVMSLIYLHHRYQAHMSLWTSVRVLVASGVTLTFLLVAQAPDTLDRIARLGVLVGKGALGALIFMAVLALLREFTQEDRARLRRVLKRTPKGAS